MNMSDDEAHIRFKQQAEWTKAGREYVYTQLDVRNSHRILEVGCGTGVITRDLDRVTRAKIFGIDIHHPFLVNARDYDTETFFSCADVSFLPFPNAYFDIVLCHYFLMWISPPQKSLQEMIRVTRVGGMIAALAEPDYGGRIDYPELLDKPGELQDEYLRELGAETHSGRRLSALFNQAGLQFVRHGIYGGEWDLNANEKNHAQEWAMMKSDLEKVAESEDIATWHGIDQQAWNNGERVLFIPTFYAWGEVAE